MEGRLLLAILVDTLADEVGANGVTSLREAIVEAASSPGDDVITFAPDLSGAISLSLGELTLDDASGAVTSRGEVARPSKSSHRCRS